MRLIAHRVFRDEDRLERFDGSRIAGFDGVELDLRLDPCGALAVRHSPVFAAGRTLHRLRGNRFDDVMRLLEREPEGPGVLLLDVKCVTAAEAAADRIAAGDAGREVVFACWHAAEVDAIRTRVPDATILFCIAPIVARRAPQAVRDLYVTNSFPFLWSAQRFAPRLAKTNRHNINVKVIARDGGAIDLPDGVDGICLHRLFWRPTVAGLLARAGLKAAVYGLGSRAQAQAAAALGPVSYAIIGEGRAARREAERLAAA